MNDEELAGENRVYANPELLEDFLQNILWPFLDFGPDTLAFFSNNSDLTDFLPGMEEPDYQKLVDAINQRYGIAMQTRDCDRIYQILERIRDDKQVKRVWEASE